MESHYFPTLTLDTAAAEARPHLERAQQRFGFIPLPLARHAHAPVVLEAFESLKALFETTSFTALEREIIIYVIARQYECHLCERLHEQLLRGAGASAELVRALQSAAVPSEPRHAALARFTELVLLRHGGVSDGELAEFVNAGFNPRQALEVTVGCAAYTVSTFANRMTRSHSLR